MNIPISDELKEPLADLGQFLKALGPYAKHAVVVGGMIPIIYRHLQNASPVQQAPLATFDLDIAVPDKLKEIGATNLNTMLTEGGFTEHLRGSTPPPATVYQHVRHGEKPAPIYVELLAPLTGSDNTRDEKKKVQTEVQQKVTAQLIRYLDVLQVNPIAVQCNTLPFLGIDDPAMTLRIPNPGMYIIQKVLCREKRRPNKKDKDLAYVYDVVSIFRTRWQQIGKDILQLETENAKYAPWINKALKSLTQLFDSPTSIGPVAVVREISTASTGVPPTEAAVHQIMTKFMEDSGLRKD